MELRQIKELMAAMRRHGVDELSYEKDGLKLQLKTQSSMPAAPAPAAPMSVPVAAPQPGELPASKSSFVQEEASAKAAPEPENDKHLHVKSPIVGTFYTAPSPDSSPFVKVGDVVEESTVVCIVEAMKVMNEVKAGVSGKVVECFVEDGHPVEFGSKLFAISQE